MSKQPLLSIGMIVKNEIRSIEKCLKALQPLRDAVSCELVIADTGSTDGTREIVERYADILFDFEWINDFSAARNAVLERCTGKWYMTVDADEYLVPELDELVEFLTGSEVDAFEYAYYIVRNHTSLDLKGLYSDFFAPRLARMHPELRYHGEIHESFLFYVDSKIRYLKKTVFDHDGYASVTPEHMKKKAERNLALLEPILEAEPNNLRRLLQCIEASNYDNDRRIKYVRRGMEQIMAADGSDPVWKACGPSIARYGVIFSILNSFPEAEDWYRWAFEHFPNNTCLKVDGNFYYLSYLHDKKRYNEMISLSDRYFDAVKQYEDEGPTMGPGASSECYCAHPIKANGMRVLLAEAYLEDGKKRQAVKQLESVDLENLHAEDAKKWFYRFEKMVEQPSARKALQSKLLPFYKNRNSSGNDKKNLWAMIFAHIRYTFAVERDNENGICRLYEDFPGTIGICAKLVAAQSAEEGQVLIDQIEDWEELMPLALARALELGCALPDGFYRITPERLRDLTLELVKHWKNAAQYALSATEPEQLTDWHRLCFSFDLLCAIGMDKKCFEGDHLDTFSERLAQIGALYLENCYHPNVLEDEDAIDRLPPLHRFTWHYVRAVTSRVDNDWAGYMRSLRKALKTAELMKDFVEHLLGYIDIEEIKRNERIAAAPPELRELAEKVKSLLAQYPADDPSVIAMKKTPVYQKVAYLIEDSKDHQH